MKYSNRKRVTYPFELKLEAVKLYFETSINRHEIAKILEIGCDKTLLSWIRKYEEFGEDGLKERRGRPRKNIHE